MQWYLKLRDRLAAAGLWPRSRTALVACYLALLAAVFFALQKVLAILAPSWGEHLGGWVGFLLGLAAILFVILGFGWLKRRILWRLRNRLIVTYVFIGVIPAVLLVAMALITLYGIAGQFAVYVLTSEIQSQLRSMEATNAAVSNELAARLERNQSASSDSLAGLRKRDSSWGRRRVCAWLGDKALPISSESQSSEVTLPAFVTGTFREIVSDRGGLHLRVASSIPIGDSRLVVVTSEPFDKELVGKIAADLGEITLYSSAIAIEGSPQEPRVKAAPSLNPAPVKPAGKAVPPPAGTVASRKPELVSRASAADAGAGPGNNPAKPMRAISINTIPQKGSVEVNDQVLQPTFTVGSLPQASGNFDREILFGAPLSVRDWQTGDSGMGGVALRVRTRPSVLYGHLFAALGNFIEGVRYFLVGVAIIFAIIELIALIIGTRMTRTVTAAVAQLHEATRHVDRGDFSHRIAVKSDDQLAELANSFNSMTASIEKLIIEQKEKQRLENELVIAQEVQAQLFPRQVSELESLEVHGFCRPARTVSGDYYDFVSASSHKLILAVGDISGKGISAALLMATIHSAVRAYSVESLPQLREPVGVAGGGGRRTMAYPDGIEVSSSVLLGLLNHQLYESTPPEKYATLFLGIYDARSNSLTYSNGGHLPPFLIGEDGTVRKLEAGGTVVGLFDNMTYDEDTVEMRPGEMFVAYSDGVTEPENDFGEFGEERLLDLVRENRHLPLEQISQIVTTAVDDWIGDKEQPDDVTLVLARAR
jgi:phosphoserine phosphatase RsbU/P